MRNTYPFLLALVGMLASPVAFTQQVPDSLNLVPNGSFEEMQGKLRRLGGIDMAKGWSSPTGAKADLFSETIDNSSPAYAPKNALGFQSPLSGLNYAGLVWYSYMDKQPRTYVQVKLKETLKKGQKYCLSYYVSLGDLSKYSSDNLGAYFSKIQVNKKDMASLTYKPQVPALLTQLYEDPNAWKGVCGVYEANGDEQFLIIGNFAATEKVTTGKVRRQRGEVRPQQPIAYYYIDDVSVKPVKYLNECSCEQIDQDKSEFIYSRRETPSSSLKPGDRVARTVIYFKRFNGAIDPSMQMQVDTLASVLKANPDIRITLTGHTDLTEVDKVRMRPDLAELDKDRARSVKEYLVEAGIEAGRISVAGKKGDRPATDETDDVSMSQNRRVVVEVTP